jgi:hypothetical protein
MMGDFFFFSGYFFLLVALKQRVEKYIQARKYRFSSVFMTYVQVLELTESYVSRGKRLLPHK